MAHYPNGKYIVQINGYATGESERKKTPFFRIFFDVIQQLHADGSSHPVDQQYEREATLYLTPAADWAVEKTFEALKSTVSLDPTWLRDTTHEAYCVQERGDDGKMYERWSFYQPGGSGKRQDMKELPDRQRRTEEEKLKRRLGITANVPTTAEVEKEATTMVDTDECPF